MATNTEEILMRVGLDSSGIDTATRRLLDTQKKASGEYVSFWKKAVDDRVRAETQADVEIATRRNQTRRLMRQRELEQERRHARDMAQVEQGYIPETWQRAAALNERYRKYGYGPERAGMGGSIIGLNVASSAADGLLSGQEADKLGRDVANAAAEGGLFFIVYELIKSAFKITAKNIGKNVLGKIPSGTVPVLLPAATAGYFITDAKKDADLAADAMIASNQYKEFNPYTAAGRDILRALNSGRLSFEQAKRLRGDFGNRGYELPESLGFRTDDGSKVRDWIQYLNDFRRQEADFAARQTYLSGAATTLAQIFANRNAIGARIAAMQSAVNANNFETVSPADIAGRDFSATLARQYGEGGKYDLGAGKGRLARVAQEYEKARYAQMWWRMQGDKFNADFAKERMNKMEGILVDYGAATEKMNIAAMRSGIDTMTKQLNNLSVRIIGTE